ncbi:MAG: galactose oxidase-like domain-containing protein, partial [Nitrososphaerales archaeon]
NNTASQRGKVMIVGGSIDWQSPATAVCEMIDFDAGTNTAPVFRTTGSLSTGRRFPVPIMLPTGELMVFGGAYGLADEYVRTPELFNVQTEAWSTLPAAKVSRTYHQSGLLLLDGRVWTASGQPNRAEWERRTEIFSPWYMFAGTRPVINGRVKSAPYGGTLRIPTTDGAGITKVSLVRLPTYTHHYNPDMRLIWLQIISSDSTGVTVSAPINNRIAPPGDYMIHILNSANVPSEAKVVRLPA